MWHAVPDAVYGVAVATRVTTPEAVERIALELFAAKGFEETTVEEVAAAAGISRRTLFRYFATKNDIVWAGFGALLETLDRWLAAVPDDVSMFDALADAAVRFNRLPTDGVVAHRERMTLIVSTPSMAAHATLRWAEWRDVVARFAARRLGDPVEALGPQLVGHLALGAGLAGYEEWLRDGSSDLEEVMRRSFGMLDEMYLGAKAATAG
jgi:TetR/AcrR family transcriptional regulator, regulator of mycofactocin system